ncbi:aKG-HExxH-type peptide beta-hydroxylase [Nocardia sp. NPDC101769]|uniref:aKG-HExxH-type peptide beta-hydroxylase n=1 Tax=Nocardia sp. NPDC101769 TaxID=3364333 RepID=UPI00382314F6
MRSRLGCGTEQLATLTVPADQIDALARLSDEPGTLGLLQRSRLSRNLAFLAAIVRAPVADDSVRTAFELLADMQRTHPDAVRDTLQHPRFGAWAAVCAAALAAGGADQGGDAVPAAHLASFAAAAAIRTGTPFDLWLPVSGDTVVVPGLGCWTGPAADPARVRSTGSTTPPEIGQPWMPVRRLAARLPDGVVTVEFDDLPSTPAAWPDLAPADPRHRWRPSPESEFDDWQRLFEPALELLRQTVPELAGPLCRGMRAIMPRSPGSSSFVSSTLADSFGAAAMVLPPDDLAAATALLHEFQHSKLCALMEVVPLIAVEGAADLPSPWRREPRPASAVLHGIYAHLAVARLHARASRQQGYHVDGVLVREQTLDACDTLLHSDRLTPTGHRFVQLMRHTALHDGRTAATNRRTE